MRFYVPQTYPSTTPKRAASWRWHKQGAPHMAGIELDKVNRLVAYLDWALAEIERETGSGLAGSGRRRNVCPHH